ncbi:aldolase/citrate lyase family protein [Pseudomonas donghuensis]|uniref:aldolase/citrate lyase family protein n=1 Tax=Pseudomonas donghuensis TaxID=1163398 RepID=UPI0020C3FE25|nr:aldolase/citrate lyase family protein [Pseudomonas donghuensis]MBF4210498.1 aldolase [Pseudomonas donghuensis]MCP6700053.1 HpcH/HpaI aldolase/citrate lyase family protein [Pseudomonas donghuensis]UVL22963.1 aldolase/citrate lyase family protein [Pseudomonas donghuensis]
MKLLMITNCPDVARFAVESGVDRIFVDTEILGKEARQGHLNTVISRHTLEDVRRVRSSVPAGRLLVRINPVHPEIQAEVDQAIEAGADILMLPMFRTPDEVKTFVDAVDGRARCSLLVETVAAANSLRECVQVKGVDEVHIGLNDLHLEQGLDFMFELLANGMVDGLAQILREVGMTFGIGGVARVGEGMLPAELLMAEHVRLGSSAAILSRTFHRDAKSLADIQGQMDFAGEVRKLREVYEQFLRAEPAQLQAAHQTVQQNVGAIVTSIRSRRANG